MHCNWTAYSPVNVETDLQNNKNRHLHISFLHIKTDTSVTTYSFIILSIRQRFPLQNPSHDYRRLSIGYITVDFFVGHFDQLKTSVGQAETLIWHLLTHYVLTHTYIKILTGLSRHCTLHTAVTNSYLCACTPLRTQL